MNLRRLTIAIAATSLEALELLAAAARQRIEQGDTVRNVELARLKDAFDRLVTIVDEAFGLQAPGTVDELLGTLERELCKQRQRIDELAREVESRRDLNALLEKSGLVAIARDSLAKLHAAESEVAVISSLVVQGEDDHGHVQSLPDAVRDQLQRRQRLEVAGEAMAQFLDATSLLGEANQRVPELLKAWSEAVRS